MSCAVCAHPTGNDPHRLRRGTLTLCLACEEELDGHFHGSPLRQEMAKLRSKLEHAESEMERVEDEFRHREEKLTEKLEEIREVVGA